MPPIPGSVSVGLASLASLARPCAGAWQYDPEQKIESARLFGNMHQYAYYFTDIMVGKPTPQRVSVIIDTGSRLSGFPCAGCDHCGEHLDPPFDISSSETASWSSCAAEGCTAECVGDRCSYRESYAEGSSLEGFWFTDFVELGDSFSKNPAVRVKMGCHDREDNLFFSQKANGIMGLAPSMGSQPTILQELFHDGQHIDARVFAICLAGWGGRMTLGGYNSSYHLAKPGGEPVQWVALRMTEYYFVSIDGLGIVDGRETVHIGLGATANPFGATIVDSGTTYTYFPDEVFSALATRLEDYCAEHGGCGADRESDRCWRLRGGASGPTGFPPLAVQFSGGVSVEWEPRSYLQQHGDDALWCRTFMGTTTKQTILGISFMLYKDFIFDLALGRLGIADAQCPEYVKQPSEGGGGPLGLEQRRGQQAPQLAEPRLGAPLRRFAQPLPPGGASEAEPAGSSGGGAAGYLAPLADGVGPARARVGAAAAAAALIALFAARVKRRAAAAWHGVDEESALMGPSR